MRFVLSTGEVRTRDLLAFDPARATAFDGVVTFNWINDEAELETYRTPGTAVLTLRVSESGEVIEIPITQRKARGSDELIPLGDSGFSYDVVELVEDLPMPNSQTGTVSLAVVDFESPEGERFTRWVFPDQSMNRDVKDDGSGAHAGGGLDTRISASYTPASRGAPIRVVAGPGDIGAYLVIDNETLNIGGEPVSVQPLTPGGSVTLPAGLTISLDEIITNAREDTRPVIIPKEQRDRNTETALLRAMAQVEIARGGLTGRTWLPFHGYSIEGEEYAVMNSGMYAPTPFVLEDGRRFELLFSRERRELPTPVRLEDFIVTSHIGGFSPRDTRSIRDWTSEISFVEDGAAVDEQSVSTNDPASHNGYWFFQRTWDPDGQRFTGLGVGNRIGVYTQLVGSCIAVLGMIYAFYVKPIIRRKRRLKVYDAMTGDTLTKEEEVTA
jgi:hypothetical protein